MNTGNEQKTVDILNESGCTAFIHKYQDILTEELKRAVPKAFALLDDKAVEALRGTLWQRLLQLYIQPLMLHVNNALRQYDLLGMILGRPDPDALRKAAAAVLHTADESAEGNVDLRLCTQYPLLKGYTETICQNTAAAFGEFLERLYARKDDLSGLLPEGRPFERITGFTTGGADMHRHGRCVIGVTTDAGVFYYKPHDCRIDTLYRLYEYECAGYRAYRGRTRQGRRRHIMHGRIGH